MSQLVEKKIYTAGDVRSDVFLALLQAYRHHPHYDPEGITNRYLQILNYVAQKMSEA